MILPEDQRRPILVVDDDAEVVALARRVLIHSGWLVDGTTDPRDAVEIAVRSSPCLVFVDLMMPHMDGEDFLWALRDRLKDRMPKVALLSASYSRHEVARRMNVDASIAKPFEIEDLRDVAVRFASEHRDRKQSLLPPNR